MWQFNFTTKGIAYLCPCLEKNLAKHLCSSNWQKWWQNEDVKVHLSIILATPQTVQFIKKQIMKFVRVCVYIGEYINLQNLKLETLVPQCPFLMPSQILPNSVLDLISIKVTFNASNNAQVIEVHLNFIAGV